MSKEEEVPATPAEAAGIKELFKAHPDALRFAVAVDGSELAHKAFLATVDLMNKGDFINVVHVADPSKSYLPHDLRPDSIQENYERHCLTRFVPERYNVVRLRKEDGGSTREAICHYVNSMEFDYLVVGMVGRKGPKEDPTILGSTADYSLRQAHCSSVIVKKAVDGPNKFVVGVDGSDRSHKTVEQVINMANPDDSVVIVHVTDDDAEAELDSKYHRKAVSQRYTKLANSTRSSRTTFQSIPQDRGLPVSDNLVNFAREEDATFLAVGADGLGAHAAGRVSFGSNSDRMVKHSKCNIIVTQDRNEVVYSKRR